jgi:hypothetical protein
MLLWVLLFLFILLVPEVRYAIYYLLCSLDVWVLFVLMLVGIWWYSRN